MSEQDATKPVTPSLSPAALFARNFLKYPLMLGSLFPSSPFLVNDMVSKVDWDHARVVVEFGPGVGTITREILKRMHHDAVLVAIELNDDFVEYLSETIQDRRLRVVHASAAEVRNVLASLNLTCADSIISSIPYSTLSEAQCRTILEESRQALRSEGSMVMFQFTRTVLPYLRSSFSSVKQGFQLFNILPAQIFFCTP